MENRTGYNLNKNKNSIWNNLFCDIKTRRSRNPDFVYPHTCLMSVILTKRTCKNALKPNLTNLTAPQSVLSSPNTSEVPLSPFFHPQRLLWDKCLNRSYLSGICIWVKKSGLWPLPIKTWSAWHNLPFGLLYVLDCELRSI